VPDGDDDGLGDSDGDDVPDFLDDDSDALPEEEDPPPPAPEGCFGAQTPPAPPLALLCVLALATWLRRRRA
jgi:hypothetical protein